MLWGMLRQHCFSHQVQEIKGCLVNWSRHSSKSTCHPWSCILDVLVVFLGNIPYGYFSFAKRVTSTLKQRNLVPIGFPIERFHSRGQHLRKFIRTKESVYIKKEFYSLRIGLEHQHGRRDVMWKRSVSLCY